VLDSGIHNEFIETIEYNHQAGENAIMDHMNEKWQDKQRKIERDKRICFDKWMDAKLSPEEEKFLDE
jgi:hypothetical protein